MQSRQRKSMGMKKAAWGILLFSHCSLAVSRGKAEQVCLCTIKGGDVRANIPLWQGGWFPLHSGWQIWDKF